ncbi:hypothetical protein [Streptomyces mirabilis]|uniref:hypothetical protein n=1 Tax=Streptomyces mirabilis TaxID=68239 RepID=UPI0036EFE120
MRLAEASCAEGCCGALCVTIQRDGDYVLWGEWRNPDEDEVDVPASLFEAQEHQREVERATADRSWEWPARTVARLLEQDLRERTDWLARWECELGALSASERLAEQLVAADPRQAAEVRGGSTEFARQPAP